MLFFEQYYDGLYDITIALCKSLIVFTVNETCKIILFI